MHSFSVSYLEWVCREQGEDRLQITLVSCTSHTWVGAIHCYVCIYALIAAPRVGGVGSCWILSTNSMSNLHLIPSHWVIEMLSHQHSYWILLCQTSHSLFCKKASAKVCFLDLFSCCSPSPFLLSEPSGWTWWAQYMCVWIDIQYAFVWFSTDFPIRIPAPCLVRIVLSGVLQAFCCSDNLLIYWTVCCLGFITVFWLTLASRLVSGKCPLWSSCLTSFISFCFASTAGGWKAEILERQSNIFQSVGLYKTKSVWISKHHTHMKVYFNTPWKIGSW